MGALMLDRREFVRRLLIDRGDLLVVSGLGSATYDVAAAGDHPLNFYLWGAMGGTAMIGLGLALARPDRRIAVLTGDGDMLMGIGSLATIGVKQPRNLSIIVLDNAHYGETGMQPSATQSGIDLVATALACRFKCARTIVRIEDTADIRALLHSGEGPLLVDACISSEDVPRVLPLRDGHAIRQRFVGALDATARQAASPPASPLR
jgi:thiamine pyrophosphate-dependent acetolactate synthase large subunit-like protein